MVEISNWLISRKNNEGSRDGQDNQASCKNDRESRDGQVAQANRSQMISIASPVELSQGGENQQQALRVKQENKVLPGTSRQANMWTNDPTPIIAERSQIRRQPVGSLDPQPSPLKLQPLNVDFDLNQSQD